MRPGPDLWQQAQIRGRDSEPRDAERIRPEALVARSEAQRLLIGALQAHGQGMTVRQLEAKLSWPTAGLQEVLDGLLETHVIGQLNTIIPSYVYRYGSVDLDVD